MDKDNDGILEPALKIGPDWPATRLEAWANKEGSTFGAVAKLLPYTSQGGRNLERIVFALPSQPGPQVAEMYFGDDGEWWVQHYHTPVGRELAYHVYNQLLAQGIALTLPEWGEKILSSLEIIPQKRRRGRPEPKIKQTQARQLKVESPAESPTPTVKHSPAKLALSRIRIQKFEEFMKAHPTGYTPDAAAKLAIGKTYRTIQRDYELLNQDLKQSIS